MKRDARRLSDLAFLVVQVLCVGLTLPVLSAFGVGGSPIGLEARWRHLEAAASDLGLVWQPGAITPGARQTGGFEDLLGLVLSLGAVVLLVGCATLSTLVVRRSWGRREELSVHTALGATRSALRRMVLGDWAVLVAIGSVLGLGLGIGLDAWVRALAPEVVIAPETRFSTLSALAILGPVAAVFAAASIEARGAIRRMREPLAWNPVARLVQLGLGATYLGALLALLSTAAVLLRGSTATESAGGEWAEARDTLVIDVEETPRGELTGLMDRLNPESDTSEGADARMADAETPDVIAPWHLASAGAFEDLGVSDATIFECYCVLGLISAPVVRVLAQHHSVSPGIFKALGVTVLDGREFDETDGPDAPRVAIVDLSLIAQFRGVDPVGKMIRIGARGVGSAGDWYEIIGLVDVPEGGGLATRTTAIGGVYLSALQHPPQPAQLLVSDQSRGGEAALASLAAAAPELMVGPVRSLADRRSAWEAPMRWFGAMAALLGALVTVIGVLGLGSTIALEVRARVSELGVHRALGARRRQVQRLVLADVGRVVVWGGALGLIFGPALVRGLSTRFADLGGLDVTTSTWILAALALVIVVGAAGPLRYASRITPIEAMGSD